MGHGRARLLHAFTLIELLVVIAIVSIIAALLFPVFARARAKARQTTCLSNEKQIGAALLQYTQDADEAMPPAFDAVGTDFHIGWRYLIAPYLKSQAVMTCPDNPDNGISVSAAYDDSLGIKTSYSANCITASQRKGAFSRSQFLGAPPVTVTLADQDSPAQLVAIVESTLSWAEYDVTAGNGGSGGHFNSAPSTTTISDTEIGPTGAPYPIHYVSYGTLFAGHSGFSNVLFCDGHAKAVRPAALLPPTTGAGGNPWAADSQAFDAPAAAQARLNLNFAAQYFP